MASIRFAIWQKAKYRMIDDASGDINGTFGAEEQIHTTSAAAAAAACGSVEPPRGRHKIAPALGAGVSAAA